MWRKVPLKNKKDENWKTYGWPVMMPIIYIKIFLHLNKKELKENKELKKTDNFP